jgi:hypothetical protein
MSVLLFPKPSDRHGKGCYLYLIRETGGPGEHLHKVGIARDVRTRLAQLQTANGRPLTLASWWHTPNIITARRVERTILDRLAERRQVGEWLCGPWKETRDLIDAIRTAGRRGHALEAANAQA